jgi:hypothetical protein
MGNRALYHAPIESGSRERSHLCEDGSKLAKQECFTVFVKGGPYLAQGNSGDILHDDIEIVLISIHGVKPWCRDGKLLLDETQRVALVFRDIWPVFTTYRSLITTRRPPYSGL